MSSATSPETDPLIGRVVAGRYEVVSKLNEGGVGAVYLAMQRPLDRPVALKVLLKKFADDATAIRRFEKEAAAVARLAHAHIITLYDFGTTDDGDLYIAMELLRGQSLRELLDAAGYISWERSLHIVQGVTRALVAAHTQKIVHRDLKPENIMLVESNGDLDFAKVLDFGLARSISGTGGPQITRHDVIAGTPAYMSPERANGISDDPRSDLYALGALWFELLVGQPPFVGETSIKVILRHVHETPRVPSKANLENPIPPFVDELVLQLLHKQPEQRPSSAKELLDRLDKLARPAGWHVGGPAELGQRGHHDNSLRDFAATASDPTMDLRFAVERGAVDQPEPVALVQRKSSAAMSSLSSLQAVPSTVPTPAASTTAAGEPLLLTRKKTVSMVGIGAPAAPVAVAEVPPSSQAAVTAERPQHPRPPKIESIAQVAGWLSTARTVRAVAELCTAFLASRFDRAIVVDVRDGPVVLATHDLDAPTPASLREVLLGSVVLELAGRREAYYGPSMTTTDWLRWCGILGGGVPGAMFVGGLGREGTPAFLFYADHRDTVLRPSVKDTVVLLREAAAALSAIA